MTVVVTAEARRLAERLVKARRSSSTFVRLTGDVRRGWKAHALSDGYGVDGGYRNIPTGSGLPRHVPVRPTTVEAQAGWLVWELEARA